MKSIVYILITVFISSILISAIPKSKIKDNQIVTIQCVDDNVSPEMLSNSGDIIKSRLVHYGMNDVDIAIDKNSSCINISLSELIDSKSLNILLTSTGKIEFFEVNDRSVVIKNLGICEELSSLLNIPTDDKEFSRYSGILGYCKENKKSEVELFLKNHYSSKPGYGINFYWSELPNEDGNFYLYLLNHEASLDNTSISKSSIQSDLSDTNYGLMISFEESAIVKWENITNRNIGKSIAIVLDKKVLQAPRVNSVIKGGNCTISGNFSLSEISRMNSLINNEELPLEFRLKN